MKIFALLLVLLLTGCADRFVARVNNECRLIAGTTVKHSRDGTCVVCYHKGTAVAACIVDGEEAGQPSEPPAPCLNCTPHPTEETP